MKELEAFGHLVIDFEHRGHAHQHQEAEVDHGVHEACSGVAQQGAHVDTGTEICGAPLHVLRGCATLGGGATFPVAHAVSEAERTPHDHHRNHRVEGDLQRPGDVDKHRAVHSVVVLPAGDLGQHTRHEDEGPHANAQSQ